MRCDAFSAAQCRAACVARSVASQAVSDAPAIYFVKPTDENIERMAADIKKGLYRTLATHVGRSVYACRRGKRRAFL